MIEFDPILTLTNCLQFLFFAEVTTTHSGTAKKGSTTNSSKTSSIKNASTAGIAVTSSDTSRASVQAQGT